MNTTSVAQPSTLGLRAEYKLPREIPQLDRLRGLAILLVLGDHIAAFVPSPLSPLLGQGWLGVDLFFVLSGFLITGILWDARPKNNYFKRFYGRRILRIWPAYLLMLVLAYAVLPAARHLFGGLAAMVPKEALGVWVYLLMIQNFLEAGLVLSPFLGVTWSLAIEEQFYLVWPLVIRFASRKILAICLVTAFLLSPVLRLVAMHYGLPQVDIHRIPFTHADGLLSGAMIAIWLRSDRPQRGTLLAMGASLFLVGIALFIPMRPVSVSFQYCSPLVYTVVALASSGLLLLALVSEDLGSTLHKFFFMNRPLAFLGFISYSLYLYHFFIMRVMAREAFVARFDRWHHPHLTQWTLELAGVGISIVAAWVSRVTMEQAALSRKAIFD
jgi:peptidoglycan/LPS O-acetylase OafA/YrhL